MNFTTIMSEGNLIPADLLAQIAEGTAEGQRPEDFGFDKARRLTDEIAAAWSDAREYWSLFQRRIETLSRQGRLRDDDPGTSITREFWIERLLETLGYRLASQRSAALVESRTYFISHRASGSDSGEEGPPIHVEGFRTKLDQRPLSGRPRLSPHALMQEYLNATEHLWGIVTNGERLRLLRDSSRTTRPSFVEFDLRAMLEGELFSEFAILYRLLHRSRLPQASDDAPRCLLERYHQQALDAGGRVREGLRVGVEQALLALGNGLIQHPANAKLRERVADQQLTALAYYRQLLRLVYRLLFLMTAEERRLIGGTPTGLPLYDQHYSITRLRRLAERPGTSHVRHSDLWLGLLATFRILRDDEAAAVLGVAALDGDLFGPEALPDLEQTQLSNTNLLRAIRALSLYQDPQTRVLRRVNYAALDVEELGSVYESLLDFRPVVTGGQQSAVSSQQAPDQGGTMLSTARYAASSMPQFNLVTGTERKTTGSYYTRPELVHELIKSALEPVIEERLANADKGTKGQGNKAAAATLNVTLSPGQSVSPSPREEALLNIRIVDPACGSGHFLLAAARRLGRELARVRSGEDQPAPEQFRRAVRDVIGRCIYGVDLNPLAVDLCKVALWLESLNPGLPLSFLDSHIRWGNSLVGATRALVDQGIPDDAYKPVTGDDKAVASAFRKQNKKERDARNSGQTMLLLDFGESDSTGGISSADAQALNAMPDNSVAAVRAKAARYAELRAGAYSDMVRFNLWTAAFFQPLTDTSDLRVPTTRSLMEWDERPLLHALAVSNAFKLAEQIGFFHWELEFPGFEGFDVVLGNPPWERIKLQEQEHFVDVPAILNATNKSTREKMIAEWRIGTPTQQARIAEFDIAKYQAEAESRFVRASSRFPLTAVGDVNTYALFAEHSRNLLAPMGRAGIIVPTGIATDDTYKEFFAQLVENSSIASLYDFENRGHLFIGLHTKTKFCLLTISNNPIEQGYFSFLSTSINDLSDQMQVFTLAKDDFSLFNPNTKNCALFRTKVDVSITRKIYKKVPVISDDRRNINPWGARFTTMFHMSNDSNLFQETRNNSVLPLYEAKMFWHFDHRWSNASQSDSANLLLSQKINPSTLVEPRYWMLSSEVNTRLKQKWQKNWLIVFRNITDSRNERSAVFSVLPRVALSSSASFMFLEAERTSIILACFLVTVNSIVFDYIVRQKIGGTNFTYNYVYQLPVLPPHAFSEADIAFIVPRVLELVYTAWDIKAFAEDVWNESSQESGVRSQESAERHASNDVIDNSAEDLSGLAVPATRHEQYQTGLTANTSLRAEILRRNAECNIDAPADLFAPRDGFILPPFRWNDERRALIRAELDARIARLYGLTRDELRYILDPADVYGPDFPGETFRVLKEKETKLYGEYRTRRLVLEAWDAEERIALHCQP